MEPSHLLVHGLAFLEVAHLGPQRCEVELGRCDIPVLGPKFRLELLANLDVHLPELFRVALEHKGVIDDELGEALTGNRVTKREQ